MVKVKQFQVRHQHDDDSISILFTSTLEDCEIFRQGMSAAGTLFGVEVENMTILETVSIDVALDEPEVFQVWTDNFVALRARQVFEGSRSECGKFITGMMKALACRHSRGRLLMRKSPSVDAASKAFLDELG